MVDRETRLRQLARLAWWTGARLRLATALSRFALLAPLPLLYAVVALTSIKVLRLGAQAQHHLMVAGLIPLGVVVVGVALVWLCRQAPHAGSLALDRHHDLSDRITSALAFRRLPPNQRTALMELAISDAARLSPAELSPRRAAPWPIPTELALVLGLAAALGGLSVLEVRVTRVIAPAKTSPPALLSLDDAELLRSAVAAVQADSNNPLVGDTAARFHRVIEDLEQGRLDRLEAFRQLAELEKRLLNGGAAEQNALEQALKDLANELAQSDLTRPLGDALGQGRLSDAEQALRKLAERLRSDQGRPSPAELDRLRKALDKASKSSAARAEALEERRQALSRQRDRLLKKKQRGTSSQADARELSDLERQLERLDREKRQAASAQQKLSELDRKLADAAQNLLKELGKSADELARASQDINRLSQEQMTEQQKRELLRQLRGLRELLRQQGQQGKHRLEQLKRFSQRARGMRPGPSASSKQGSRPGALIVGPGVSGAPVPLTATRPSSVPGSKSQEGHAHGANGAGPEWGTGEGPEVAGTPTAPKGETHDVTAVAKDTGQGTASSEVIEGAAERGFVGRDYQQVYTDYRAVAEDVIERDEVPPGYRFYIQRYFELIRPRR
ncbi:MAG: hypothetical protein JW940_23485 [Polyangiaceae bacterium]|nr:hypothetical protein [Polyangiaceae bacterium]